MKKNKIKIKLLYLFVLINLLFWNSAGSVQALFGSGPSVPSTEEVLDKVENRYGFDPNILRKSQTKSTYPEVEIFLDKTSPQKGEKVTATAMPKFFETSNENLYYTWFLFREGDDLKDSEVMKNAKRRAMGIVARGDFDPFLFNTDYSDGNSDSDKDGYEASFGGGDGVGGRSITPNSLDTYEAQNYSNSAKQIVDGTKITRCYRHNFGISGPEDYNIDYPGGDLIVQCKHKFAKAKKGEAFQNPYNNSQEIKCTDNYKVGDGEFETNEEACWRLDPNNPDTDGDGVKDEADLAGLGQVQLTWTFNPGDRVGVIIEGTSMIATNEGATTSSVLANKITYSCTNLVDDVYCLNASMQIGQCLDGSCSINTSCIGDSDGKPCEVSGGGTGICQTDVCQSVGSCSLSSSDGDLCESGGVEGVCNNSICVLSRCVSYGTACQTDIGTLGACNQQNICIENNIIATDTTINPYKKIIWAGLDVCDKEDVEGKNKKDLIKDDECNDSDDYGFTYLATQSVFEQNEELLKTNLNFTPKTPQFNIENNDYSDYITVSSNFSQSEVRDDFIYYDWDVYYCGQGDTEDCTLNANNRLTSSCADGDVLGNCASDNIISNSYAQGIGLNKIKLKLTDNFLSNKGEYDNFYLKVFLRTKKTKNDNKAGISSVDIPVVVNDNTIQFFKISEQNSLIYGFNEISDEICSSGSYNKICPVYPGQIIAAKADINTDGKGSSTVESYSWELNGQSIIAPGSGSSACSFSDEGCSLGDIVYLPISGSDMELQTISLKIKKTGGEEVNSERIIIVAKPMVKIISSDINTARPFIVNDGSESGEESSLVFLGETGEKVSFSAALVPDYLTNNDVKLTWYLNGQEVTSEFINANPDQEISINSNTNDISFKLTDIVGGSTGLMVEIKKEFSIKEKTLLKDNWDIKNLKNLEDKKSITIKHTTNLAGGVVASKNNSVQMFFASTLSNAPEYLIFIIRTAIVFVLLWSLVFGFNYWFGREFKTEK